MGLLKFLNLYYQVLQLQISKFKSTQYQKKIKHAKLASAILDN